MKVCALFRWSMRSYVGSCISTFRLVFSTIAFAFGLPYHVLYGSGEEVRLRGHAISGGDQHQSEPVVFRDPALAALVDARATDQIEISGNKLIFVFKWPGSYGLNLQWRGRSCSSLNTTIDQVERPQRNQVEDLCVDPAKKIFKVFRSTQIMFTDLHVLWIANISMSNLTALSTEECSECTGCPEVTCAPAGQQTHQERPHVAVDLFGWSQTTRDVLWFLCKSLLCWTFKYL